MKHLVLLIEDSPDIHNLVRFHLRKEPILVKHAYDGMSGMALVKELRPHLILLDVDLPDMTGIEICRLLKRSTEVAPTPIIFISGHSDVAQMAEALDAGGVDYITKPFNPLEIRARIRSAIRAKENSDELTTINHSLADAAAREKRRTQELLLQAEKMAALGHLVTTIGHELANPTGFVHSALQAMESECKLLFSTLDTVMDPDEPDSAEFIEFVEERKSRLTRFFEESQVAVNHMLDVSQALRRQGRTDIVPSPNTCINDIVYDALIITRGKVKFIEIDSQLEATKTFTCRRSQIGQVITNLLANAADAISESIEQKNGGKEKPTIRIETRDHQANNTEGLTLVIADNGPGIPLEHRKDVFENYFTTKPTGIGTGLGLPLCKEIVENHDGRISISDDPVLGGARFELWFPFDSQVHQELLVADPTFG